MRRWWAAAAAAVVAAVAFACVLAYRADREEAADQVSEQQRAQAAAECGRVRDEVAAERAFNTTRPGPAVAFLGDSYTVGRGAPSMTSGFAVRTAELLGLAPFLAGSSGSGYVGTGMCHDSAFGSRVDEVVGRRPQIVVLQGGLNDRGVPPDRLVAAARDVADRVRRSLPEAVVVVLGPIEPRGDDPLATEADRATRRGAEGAGVAFIDPMAEGWVTPGNRSTMISPDRLHLSPAGHEALARRLADRLRVLPLDR